ncbi:MAG: AMP-binding protein [Spirochaetaceae bacterium]|jgi:acyl-coenzyme A synthetase/AMP-(fatty) acid ligase/uncharacterized membrane protein|nr:AMP-binding protein [Spirochaetaceae bacterium]
MKALDFFRRFALKILIVPVIALIVFFAKELAFLQLYPVIINLIMLFVFGISFFIPPVIIFRFATLGDKSIKGSPAEKQIYRYCRKVTLVWCLFFVGNGAFALFTFFSKSKILWLIYNGFISYILIGILIFGEMGIRKMMKKKISRAVPLSMIKSTSRAQDLIVCYDGIFSDGIYKYWKDFIRDTAKLCRFIQSVDNQKWFLHCEDSYFFIVAFNSLQRSQKTILLTANLAPSYLAEIRDKESAFLSDQNVPDSYNINDILSADTAENAAVDRKLFDAALDPEKASVVLFTSGSTGKQKAFEHSLSELETDNCYLISKWGKEFLTRPFCSTVSQHHIYGLLDAVLLPFTAGIPFRQTRIEFPEELNRFCDTPYTIITVPAFLKRVVEIDIQYQLKTPLIFSSGGALPRETAQKTEALLGFWPVEFYGSTETAGIAYRISKDGENWKPYDTVKIWMQEDGEKKGALVVRSPYIKDKAGFISGDLVQILEDGSFLLKGRVDSIVKIEEKRVSLTEVESRLMLSGLVSEAAVIALEDRRQYLAAAIVFNKNGEEFFKDMPKFGINNYFTEYLARFFEPVVLPKKWRYIEKIPVDSQGKKKKDDIKYLFNR